MKEKYLKKDSNGGYDMTFSCLLSSNYKEALSVLLSVGSQENLILIVRRLSANPIGLKNGSAWLVLNKTEKIETLNATREYNYDSVATFASQEPVEASDYEDVMGCELPFMGKDFYQLEYNIYLFSNVDVKTMLKKISEASSVEFFVTGNKIQCSYTEKFFQAYAHDKLLFRTYVRACYSCFYENIYPDELHHFTKFKFNKWMFYIPLLVFFSAYGVYKGGVGGFILLTCVAAFAICILELARMVLKLVWMVIRGIF